MGIFAAALTQIVNLTLQPGASVALAARAHGLNANQVFKWRRAFERGELVDSSAACAALPPVTASAPTEAEIREPAPQQQPVASGSIRIEFPGRAMIGVESWADPVLLRLILELGLWSPRSRFLDLGHPVLLLIRPGPPGEKRFPSPRGKPFQSPVRLSGRNEICQ